MICHDGLQALPQHFSFRLARTDADLRETFALRYRVYCRELGWESPRDCVGGFERDAFDGRSAHALLIHNLSGAIAGCVRLVMPDAHDLQAALPFEAALGRAVYVPPANLAGSFARRDAFGEVSRFAVTADFRRRVGDAAGPVGWPPCGGPINAACDRRTSEPLVAYALVMAATALFMESGLGHAYALMAPELQRLIRMYQLPFTRLAGPFDHHGPRVLYLIGRTDVLRSLNTPSMQLLAQVHAQMYGATARRPIPLPAGSLPAVGIAALPDCVRLGVAS